MWDFAVMSFRANSLSVILIASKPVAVIEPYLRDAASEINNCTGDSECLVIAPGQPPALQNVAAPIRFLPQDDKPLGAALAEALGQAKSNWILIPGTEPEFYRRLISSLWSSRRAGHLVLIA